MTINVKNHAVTIESMKHRNLDLPVMSVCSGLNGLDIDWNEHVEHQHCDHFNVFCKKYRDILKKRIFGM